MTKEKKKVVRYLFYIIAGITLLIPLATTVESRTGYTFWVFTFILINSIRLVLISDEFIRQVIPETIESYDESSIKRLMKLFGALSFILLFWLLYESNFVEYTMNAMPMMFLIGVIGILFGMMLIALLVRVMPALFDYIHTNTIVGALMTCSMFLMMLAGSYFNRLNLDPNKETCDSFELVRKSMKDYKGITYYLFITIGDEDERYEVSQQIFDSSEPGKIKLCFNEGRLGYRVITNLRE